MKVLNYLLLICMAIYLNESILQAKKTHSTSNIQQQITGLTAELKKINTELKKIIGPESEKQIAASKKKRQEREKIWEQRSKERKTLGRGSSTYSPPSSHGGYKDYGSYGGYGSSGRGYSPSYGSKSYSGGGFGSEPSGWDSDFGPGKAEKTNFGKDKSDDNVKTEEPENKEQDKEIKKGKLIYKGPNKKDKEAIERIKTSSDDIKEALTQVLKQFDEIHATPKQSIEARDKIYSELLTEDETLKELKIALNKRKEAVKHLSKELVKKYGSASAEEKQLWRKFLPHLTRMLVFIPESEELEPIKNVSQLKGFIRNLEKEKLISPDNIKNEQETIESEIISRINNLKNTKTKPQKGESKGTISEENQEKIDQLEDAVRHNLVLPAQHSELQALIKDKKEGNPKALTSN